MSTPPPQGLGSRDPGGRQQRLPWPPGPSLPPLLLPAAAAWSLLPATHTPWRAHQPGVPEGAQLTPLDEGVCVVGGGGPRTRIQSLAPACRGRPCTAPRWHRGREGRTRESSRTGCLCLCRRLLAPEVPSGAPRPTGTRPQAIPTGGRAGEGSREPEGGAPSSWAGPGDRWGLPGGGVL